MSPIYQASSETIIPLPQGTFLLSLVGDIIKESGHRDIWDFTFEFSIL